MPGTSPESICIIEVGPRDGLQNESVPVPSTAKIAFIEALVEAGLRDIETTSFVDPKRIPSMADAEVVYGGVTRQPGARYIGLLGNMRGYERARAVGCDTIALFAAASEGFSRANAGVSIDDSLRRFEQIAKHAAGEGVAMRGYVSTIFACPYDGPVWPEDVRRVASRLIDLGCYEVSFADTTGVGTPADVRRLLDLLLRDLPADKIALHFHDTWGMGAANAVAGVEYGVRRFDASAGGLGGCPFAPGASGNVATEDLIYLFHKLGFDTGVDLAKVIDASALIGAHLGRRLASRVHQASLLTNFAHVDGYESPEDEEC